MGICVSICKIVLKSYDDKFPSVFWTKKKQEGNAKRAFYSDRQFEDYNVREGQVIWRQLNVLALIDYKHTIYIFRISRTWVMERQNTDVTSSFLPG